MIPVQCEKRRGSAHVFRQGRHVSAVIYTVCEAQSFESEMSTAGRGREEMRTDIEFVQSWQLIIDSEVVQWEEQPSRGRAATTT